MGGGEPTTEDKSLALIAKARRENRKWLIFFAAGIPWCLILYAVSGQKVLLFSAPIYLLGCIAVVGGGKLWDRTERHILYIRDVEHDLVTKLKASANKPK